MRTTISLVASVHKAISGQPLTLTATVKIRTPGSGTPTGTVTFMDGTKRLGTGTLNASGQATLVTSLVGAATHKITAVYEGDTNFGSSSVVLTEVVQAPPAGPHSARTSTASPDAATLDSAVSGTDNGERPRSSLWNMLAAPAVTDAALAALMRE